MKNCKLALAVLVFFATGFAQNPDEWPIVHNLNHTSFSATTVLKPPLKLKWATKVPDGFEVGPVVAESMVVAQSRCGYVYCLNANTGETIWRYFVKRIPAHYVGANTSGPCIWNGRVYVAFHSAGHAAVTGMRCLDLKTGNLLWKKDVGYTDSRIKYSPQVSKGKLFFCSNRELTGATTENTAQLIYKAQVQCWDALTGDTLWTYNMWDAPCVNTTLLAVGDTVFASVGVASGNASGKTVVFDLGGNVKWSSTQYHVSGYLGNLQYIPGKLMMLTGDGGNATTILNTGSWSVALSGGGGDCYSKISAVMNGKYWNRGYGGNPTGYSLTTGAQVAQCNSPLSFSSGCSAPVAANGYIYNAYGHPGSGVEETSGHMWIGFSESGQQQWSFRTSSNNCPTMAIAYNRLYTASGVEGILYCFENAQ